MEYPSSVVTKNGKISWGGIILLVGVTLAVTYLTSLLFRNTLEVYDDQGNYLGSGKIKTKLADWSSKDSKPAQSTTTTTKQ